VINGDRSKLKPKKEYERTFEIFPIAWKCLWEYVLRSVNAKLGSGVFSSKTLDKRSGHFMGSLEEVFAGNLFPYKDKGNLCFLEKRIGQEVMGVFGGSGVLVLKTRLS